MTISHLHRRTLQDQVCELLLQEIACGTLKPGDRLPAIKQLAADTGTSFRTVQQALVKLQTGGHIVIKHGAGTFVSVPGGQLTMSDTVFLCLETEAHVYGELHTLLSRRLQTGGLAPISVDISTENCREMLSRAALSPSRLFVVHGSRYFPRCLPRPDLLADKDIISVLGNAKNLQARRVHRVLVDHQAGSKRLLEHLQERGHRHVLVVGSHSMCDEAFMPVARGLEEVPSLWAWETAGLKLSMLHSTTSDTDRVSLDEAMLHAIFGGPQSPTTIFGLRDIEVRLVQEFLARHFPGRLPQLDLIGYGNTPHSQFSLPPFSTVDWNLAAVADKVCRLITDMHAGHDLLSGTTRVLPRLILR